MAFPVSMGRNSGTTRQVTTMNRREIVTVLGRAAAWRLVARAAVAGRAECAKALMLVTELSGGQIEAQEFPSVASR